MIRDYLAIAAKSIAHRKLRSWLTVLGIVIGIAAVIALLAASQGLESSVKKSFEQFGTNKIFVMGGGGVGGATTNINTLTTDDLKTIDKVSGVNWALSYQQHTANIEFGREKDLASWIYSIPLDSISDKYSDFSYEIDQGRNFHDGERGSVIIGPYFASDFFEREVRVGNRIKIKGESFTVVGIFKPIGTTQDDSVVLISQEDADKVFEAGKDITMIEVRVKDGVNINSVAEDIERRLERARGDENFEVMTPDSLLESFGRILAVLQFVLLGVAGISLLVGGIGIANSMFTNVMERTKEIGIMKSIGAKNIDIMMVFLAEAALVGLIGGIFGVLLGSIAAKMIERYAIYAGFSILQIDITLGLIAFGLLFSVIVGIISGILPARRASKLMPVDALRGAL